MRAAVLTEVRRIEVKETKEPEVGPHELKVKVMACGLCPTDYRLFTGRATFKKPPTILGHEPAGTVAEVGAGVKEFKVGDKVAGDTGRRCGHCGPCVSGHENLCENRRQVGDGCLAEYTLVDENFVNKFDDATFVEASLTEPLSCVLNSVSNSGIQAGDVVAIVGSGQIGIMHMQVARLLGAQTVVFDLKPERLEIAGRLGADFVVDSSKEDPRAAIDRITAGAGADKVIVAIGDGRAIETGLNIVGKMGSVNLFGSSPPGTKVPLDPNLIHHYQVSVIGSFDKTREHLRQAMRLIERKKIDVGSLVTNEFGLDQTPEAFNHLESASGLKIVVRPDGA